MATKSKTKPKAGPSRIKARLLDFVGRNGDCQSVASWVVRKIAAQWHLTPGSIDTTTPFSDWVADSTAFGGDFNHASDNWASWHGAQCVPVQFAAATVGKSVDEVIDVLCGYVSSAAAAG